jgi:uncharacterized membrane protein (DUF373 family)
LFERLATRVIMVVLAFLTLYALVAACIELATDLRLGAEFVEKELLQDTFGSILTVLILLEFTHSVHTSIRHRSAIIEARSIILIAVIVVARKLILVDFQTATWQQVTTYGGIALALGVLFWLLGAAANHQRRSAPPPSQT